MIRKVVTVTSDNAAALERPCTPVSLSPHAPEERKLRKLSQDLLDTANNNYGLCLGLAANQIDRTERAFAFRDAGGAFVVVFNPSVIAAKGGVRRMPESCMSRVDAKGNLMKPIEVRRPKEIKVSALQLMPKRSEGPIFRRQEFWLKGLIARVFQHELDHLNGKVI